MKIGLRLYQKVFITIAFFIVSIIGFMVKLPSAFRHSDKGLHAAFYFLAAALLNVLFAGTRLVWHAAIFIGLYLFGIAIEYAQDYSNRFFGKRLHGRFDPEDVQWNLKGLIAFSVLWVVIALAMLAFKPSAQNNAAGPKPL